MLYLVLAATALVVALFIIILIYEMRAVKKLKDSYEESLMELAKNPADPLLEAACREKGLLYYHLVRIQEHVMLSDFPMPYFDDPDLEQDLVERDIKKRHGQYISAA